jgi:rod shape-determining protein MreD
LNFFISAAVFYIAILLESTVLENFKILGAKPDVVMLAVFFVSIIVGGLPSIFCAFLAGLAADSLSGCLIGSGALLMTLAAITAIKINKTIKIDKYMTVICVMAFTTIRGVLEFLLAGIFAGLGFKFWRLDFLAVECLYNAFCAFLAYHYLSRKFPQFLKED